MCGISAFTYQVFAEKEDAPNPVSFAEKPLMP